MISPLARADVDCATRLRVIETRLRDIDAGPEFAAVVAAASPARLAPLAPLAPSAPPAEDAPAIARALDAGARAAGVDPALVRAIAEVESGFDPRAVSPVGAQGLMQLMPATARELGVAEPFDAAENARGGARYLRTLLDRFGDATLAVAAFNAGPAAVARYGGVPPYAETRTYVDRVFAAYAWTRRR